MAKKITIKNLKQRFRQDKAKTKQLFKQYQEAKGKKSKAIYGRDFRLGNIDKNTKGFYNNFFNYVNLMDKLKTSVLTSRTKIPQINYTNNDFHKNIEFRYYQTPLQSFDTQIKLDYSKWVEETIKNRYGKRFYKRQEVINMDSADFRKDKLLKFQFTLDYDVLTTLNETGAFYDNQVVRQPKTESTTLAMSFDQGATLLKQQLAKILGGYEIPDIEFKMLTLKIYIYPKQGKGGGRTIKEACKKWDLVDVARATSNCFFHSYVLGRDVDVAEVLIKDFDKLKQRAKKLKAGVNPTGGNGTTFENIQEVVDRSKFKNPVRLYNNQYELIREFNPKVPLSRWAKPSRTVDIQFVNNTKGGHYVALLPKGSIKTDTLLQFKQQIKVQNETISLTKKDDDGLISIWKKKGLKLEDRIVAWDLECSPDKDNIQTPYALGMAFKIQGQTRYKSFWGLDCIDQFFNFIDDNIDLFHSYTLCS